MKTNQYFPHQYFHAHLRLRITKDTPGGVHGAFPGRVHGHPGGVCGPTPDGVHGRNSDGVRGAIPVGVRGLLAACSTRHPWAPPGPVTWPPPPSHGMSAWVDLVW